MSEIEEKQELKLQDKIRLLMRNDGMGSIQILDGVEIIKLEPNKEKGYKYPSLMLKIGPLRSKHPAWVKTTQKLDELDRIWSKVNQESVFIHAVMKEIERLNSEAIDAINQASVSDGL